MINIIVMITLVKLGRHYHDQHQHFHHLGQTWYDRNLVQCKGLELVLNVVPSGGWCLGQDPGGDPGYGGDGGGDCADRADRGDRDDGGNRDDGGYHGDRADYPEGGDGGVDFGDALLDRLL